jgi:hypothetical protein
VIYAVWEIDDYRFRFSRMNPDDWRLSRVWLNMSCSPHCLRLRRLTAEFSFAAMQRVRNISHQTHLNYLGRPGRAPGLLA